MKKLVFLVTLIVLMGTNLFAKAVEYPRAVGMVNDFAGMLSVEEVKTIEADL